MVASGIRSGTILNMPEYIREHFGPATLLGEVPFCARTDQRAGRPGLVPHVHRDAFEVCLVRRGALDCWVEDQIFTVRAGEVFLARPGEYHGSVGSVVYPSELYFFQLAQRQRRPVGVSSSEAASIRGDLMTLPVRHLAASEELQRSIRGLVDAHRHGGPYARLAAHISLYTALVALIREGNAAHTSQPSAPVTAATKWIWHNVEQSFTVGDVSAAVGLSTARLQSRFRRELHCAIGEYRTRARLHAARRLLEDNEDQITEIAFRLGFSSSQYFATVFRQYLGITPSQYRCRLTAASESVTSTH